MKKREDKLLGSYYTPFRTVRFMRDYLAKEHKTYERVLEPSVGDGRFVDAFEKEENLQSFVAVELIEENVRQVSSIRRKDSLVFRRTFRYNSYSVF